MDLLDKMATYVRVIEAGSFSAAAKQLRISPAAVSRQIATLEAEVRATLLTRSTRRMATTSVGRRYYERCLRVLREVEDAHAVGHDSIEGLLQISAPVTFGLARVVPQVPSFMRRHPAVRLSLRLEDRLSDLAFDGVDVAIRVGSTPDSGEVVAHRLFSFVRVLVASPAYLRRQSEPKTPEALAKHDALSHVTDTWALTSDEREASVRVNVIFHSTALHALRELALSGAGIALLPQWLVADEIRRRALRVVLPAWHTEPVPVTAIHRTAHRGAPRVRALVEHLRAAYA